MDAPSGTTVTQTTVDGLAQLSAEYARARRQRAVADRVDQHAVDLVDVVGAGLDLGKGCGHENDLVDGPTTRRRDRSRSLAGDTG